MTDTSEIAGIGGKVKTDIRANDCRGGIIAP